MAGRRALVVAAAVVLSVVAGVGAYLYVSDADERAEDKVELVDAYVAEDTIPGGTTGDAALESGLIEVRKVPRTSLPPDRVTSTDELEGAVAPTEVAAGQFLVTANFVQAGEAGGAIAAALPEGLQAITVSVDAKQGVAGNIVPGDLVNVIVVSQVRKDPQAPFDPNTPDNIAAFMVQGAKVLAVGKQEQVQETTTATSDDDVQLAQSASEEVDTGLVTLQVDALDAQRIALGSETQVIYLTLVPPGYTPQNFPVIGDVAGPAAVEALIRQY